MIVDMPIHDEIYPKDPVTLLAPEESWQLLGSQQLGRLVVSLSGRIDIFPVNFVTHDAKVYFRTAEGTKLVELTIHDEVVFEVDQVGAVSAWSVVLHGTARHLTNRSDIAAADELPLRSWIPTLKYNYVEITPTEISGRRLRLGEEPERFTPADRDTDASAGQAPSG